MFSTVCPLMELIGSSGMVAPIWLFFSLKYRVESIDLLPTHTMINVDLLYAESEAAGQAVAKMPALNAKTWVQSFLPFTVLYFTANIYTAANTFCICLSVHLSHCIPSKSFFCNLENGIMVGHAHKYADRHKRCWCLLLRLLPID